MLLEFSSAPGGVLINPPGRAVGLINPPGSGHETRKWPSGSRQATTNLGRPGDEVRG